MTASPCIPESDLAHFIRGQLNSERITEIAEHVDDCETCQDTVVALADSDDTFVAALRRGSAEAPFEGEAALRQGLRRIIRSLKHLGPTDADRRTSPHLNKIGPYLIEEQLGRGGMGTVYRAVHCKLKRTVALKLLPVARWSNVAAISRFEREMEAIGGLDHPHIVRASDAGEDQGMHYLVMDYVEGLDLSRLVNRLGSLPVAEACELVRQSALGLHYVHENGLVHRDVKPSNLMLAWDRGGRNHGDASVQILDLGLALLGDEHLQDAGGLTSVGQLMGTLDYMSPEQGIDSHGVDHRTDIYGLGATLFKLLTGRAPYADPRFSTLMKKMTALATKPAPSVGDIRDDLPEEIVTIVDRMLARDPDERFSSAADVASVLAPHAERADLTILLRRGLAAEDQEPEQPIIATRPSVLPSGSRPAQVDSAGRRGGRMRFWLKSLVAAGAIALAGIAFYIFTDYGDIVVQSDDPNAQVVVKRGVDTVASLQVKQGQGKTRIRAGNYTVELDGEASEFEINPQRVDVERGKTVTISVREKHPQQQLTTAKPAERQFEQQPLAKSQSKEPVQQQAASNPEPDQKNTEEMWADAQAMYDRGNYQKALQVYDALLAQNPNFGPAHWMRGKILADIGERELALASLANASNYLPKAPQPVMEKGKIYLALGDYENALQEFGNAVRIDPFNIEALMGRGKAQLGVSEGLTQKKAKPDAAILAERAVRSFQRVLELDPENAKADAQIAVARALLDKTNAEVRASQEKLKKELEARLAERAKLLSQTNPNIQQIANIEQKLNSLAARQAEMVRKGFWTNDSASEVEGSLPSITTEHGVPQVAYRGKTYSDWARQARTERQESVLLSAVEALAILAKGDSEKEAETTRLICQMMRVHGGVDMSNLDFGHFGGTAGNPITMRHSLVMASIAALCRMGPEATIDPLLQEIVDGNTNSRDFVRLACATDVAIRLARKSYVRIDKNDARRFLDGVVQRADEFPPEWNVAAALAESRKTNSKERSVQLAFFSDGVVIAEKGPMTYAEYDAFVNSESEMTNSNIVITVHGDLNDNLLDRLNAIKERAKSFSITMSSNRAKMSAFALKPQEQDTNRDNANDAEDTAELSQYDEQQYEKAKQALRTEYGDDIAELVFPTEIESTLHETQNHQLEQQAKLQELKATHSDDHPNVRQLASEVKRLGAVTSRLTKKIQSQVDEVLAGEFDFYATIYGDTQPRESKNAPRFKGQTFDRWTRLLALETDPTRLVAAVEAVATLGSGRAAQTQEAAICLMRVMRFYGMSDPSHSSAMDARERLVLAVEKALWQLGPEATIEAVLYEIENGNPKSRDFIHHLIVKPPNWFGPSSDEAKRFRQAVRIRSAEIVRKLKPMMDDQRRSWAAPLIQALAPQPAAHRGNFSQIVEALLNYEEEYGNFPPAKHGRMSWRVAILPYLGRQDLYDDYRQDEPWDSEHNKHVLEQMPEVYGPSGDRPDDLAAGYVTGFVVPVVDPQEDRKNWTMFSDPKGTRMLQIKDGSSNTMMVLDSSLQVPWTKPVDLQCSPGQPLDVRARRHPNKPTAIAGFADGTVREVIWDQNAWKWLTKSGGERPDEVKP